MTALVDEEALISYVDSQKLERKLSEAMRVVLKERPSDAASRLAELLATPGGLSLKEPPRPLSLPAQVSKAGGVAKWNESHVETRELSRMILTICSANTVEEALQEVRSLMSLGHNLWSYAYMRALYSKRFDVYYGALLASPSELLPIVYTPTVGEACQKFGKMPFYRRGCYISIRRKGSIKKVLANALR